MFEHTFIRVYQLPDQLTKGFCFGSGVAINFQNVDWFDAPTEGDDARHRLITFIKGKRYYRSDVGFLVLGDNPDFVFTIPAEKEADHG